MTRKTNAKVQNKTESRLGPVTFSFEWVDFDQSEKFALKKIVDEAFLKQLFDELQTASATLSQDYRQKKRNHQNEWKNLTEDAFEHLPSELQDKKPFQISITSSLKARIHGFWEESVFCVVWFDPDHLLYPTDIQDRNKRGKR